MGYTTLVGMYGYDIDTEIYNIQVIALLLLFP
jgi:hypothetical protein